MNQKSEVQVRKDNGMLYQFVNVKVFQTTPYDYIIVHDDGSQRMVNRQGVFDVVIAPNTTGKILETTTTVGTA